MTEAFSLSDPVLYCDCANTRVIPEETRQRIRQRLAHCGRPVVRVADMCGRAADRDPLLARMAQAERVTLVACYPRAVRWLFHWAGAPLDPERVQCLNMREQPLEEMLAALPAVEAEAESARREDGAGANPSAEAEADPVWRPWFPVIDYDRCTQCRQCLEFCLFGVYEAEASGRIVVRRPAQCKDHCPACARLCPALAILFPKLDEDSPISGNEKDAASAAGKVCLTREHLFGGNALDRLRARQSRRPPLFKQP